MKTPPPRKRLGQHFLHDRNILDKIIQAVDPRPGEHFVIGNTTFSLADDNIELSLELPYPVSQKTFSAGFLKQLKFHKADQSRLDVLANIPDLISGSMSDEELFVRKMPEWRGRRHASLARKLTHADRVGSSAVHRREGRAHQGLPQIAVMVASFRFGHARTVPNACYRRLLLSQRLRERRLHRLRARCEHC